ncbi:MAG: hypothetical protein H6Q65_94 [Firmicutes bacterium]|nr:hypothetical protein [Bacillota bacterium]
MQLQQPKNNPQENRIAWGLLALVFAYMLALNVLMPMHRDDYGYALIWGTLDHFNSWGDVFQSLYNHYMTHGGRMVAYLVLDGSLYLGKQWYNPFMAFCYTALMVLMYWHSQRKISLRFNPYILLVIILFAWLGFPHFAEVNLWMAGATGYLFTAVLILAFLLPYHFALLQKPVWSDNMPAVVGMFLGGILAGWTIENTAVSMTLATAGFTLYFYKKKSLQKWMVSGLLGAIAGTALLVLAPGNYVRAAASTTKFIYHVTNLIAAGVETLFYVLPIVLFLVFVWRYLLLNYARKKGILAAGRQNAKNTLTVSTVLMAGVIAFLLVSYLNDNFFSQWLGNALYNQVAIQFGFATAKLKAQLFNTMSGLEEMFVYLLTVSFIFRYACTKAGLRKKDIKAISAAVSWREMLAAYPALYHAAAWIALAIVNHFVMVASPRFPARASYGSVAFLIIGAASVFTIPEVRQYWLDNGRKKILIGLISFILVPMAAATLYQHAVIHREDGQRMAYVAQMAAQGLTRLEVEPVSIKNRVLRHVYFEDLDNRVSKSHLCDYYRLEDIQLKGK